jgi:hypothetical protein
MLIKFVHDNIINTLVWASKMGRKFDPDAKRWRFRSSLIYALGNGLEVSTYLHPQYFLVLGMLFYLLRFLAYCAPLNIHLLCTLAFSNVGKQLQTNEYVNKFSHQKCIIQ